MKKFALIGAAGYVAPRHMKAIKETGNELVAALDKHDSVGILDSYFPNTHFFTEFERFDRHIDKLRRKGEAVDYLTICSPNYLHDAHIRFGLRSGMDVICEKPLVLNPWNLDSLIEIQKESGKQVNCILQLRHHPSILALKKKVDMGPKDKIYDIDLTYITSRGNWYHHSWKGNIAESGGIATNIGIHFFDMLIWIFGSVRENLVQHHTLDQANGVLSLERANVKWSLSINKNNLPKEILAAGKRTYRLIAINGKEINFTDGFTDLHTVSYQKILSGNGFGIEVANPSIQVVHDIRNAEIHRG